MNQTKWLMLGAGAVAIVRYTGVGLHAEGSMVDGWLWDVVNGASMAGMAVLEAIGILYCFESYSLAQPSRNRTLLMSLIIGMFVSLLLMLTPYVYAASQRRATADVLIATASLSLWVWSFAVAAAPLLVMAAAGVAEVTRVAPVASQDAQGEVDNTALVSQAVAGAMDALKPEFERVAGMSATTATEVARMQREVARQVAETQRQVALVAAEVSELRNQPKPESVQTSPVAQLSAGETWQAKALSLARNQIETGAQPNYTEIAQAVGKSRTAVAAAVKAKLP